MQAGCARQVSRAERDLAQSPMLHFGNRSALTICKQTFPAIDTAPDWIGFWQCQGSLGLRDLLHDLLFDNKKPLSARTRVLRSNATLQAMISDR